MEVSDECWVRAQGQHAVAHDSDAAAAAHERRDPAAYRLLRTLCHGTQVHLHYVLSPHVNHDRYHAWLGMNIQCMAAALLLQCLT